MQFGGGHHINVSKTDGSSDLLSRGLLGSYAAMPCSCIRCVCICKAADDIGDCRGGRLASASFNHSTEERGARGAEGGRGGGPRSITLHKQRKDDKHRAVAPLHCLRLHFKPCSHYHYDYNSSLALGI